MFNLLYILYNNISFNILQLRYVIYALLVCDCSTIANVFLLLGVDFGFKNIFEINNYFSRRCAKQSDFKMSSFCQHGQITR